MSSMVAKPSQNCNKKHRWLFPSMFVIVSVFCDFFVHVFSFLPFGSVRFAPSKQFEVSTIVCL